MAFTLPTLPFPHDANNVPYIASPDELGNYTVASGNWFKKYDSVSGKYLWTPVSSSDPLPVTLGSIPAGSNIIGLVKLTDGTDALAINTNGSINIVPINSSGAELFTSANPGNVQLTGSNPPLKVIETVATTTEGSSAFSCSREIISIAVDGPYDVWFNINSAIGNAGTFTVKAGQAIGPIPVQATTLYYKAVSGSSAFRALGV